jgi:osmotically inducible protein OsmC
LPPQEWFDPPTNRRILGRALSFRVIRTAGASWQGTVSGGAGRIQVGSGALDGPYSLKGRVEEGIAATNPEELLGAAEAACFTMSLANVLGEAGHPVESLSTTARVKLEQVGNAFNITSIELATEGDVPGLDQADFADFARQAKDCTISRALTGTEITLKAQLAGS